MRGNLNVPGKPAFRPGYWADGTQMSRTKIEAFQMLWFNIVSAQLGFSGTVKWDALYGASTARRLQRSPGGSSVRPRRAGRCSRHTTRCACCYKRRERGWQVVAVEPWVDDDWKHAEGRPYDQPEKELAAFAGPNGALTLLGLDSRGRALNAAVADMPAYSIGGLPPSTELNLVAWNPAGNGENAITGTLDHERRPVSRGSGAAACGVCADDGSCRLKRLAAKSGRACGAALPLRRPRPVPG